MGTLYFYHPWVFLFLLPFFGLFWYLFITKKKRSVYFSWFEELKKVYKTDSFLSRLQFITLFLSWIIFFFIFAFPYTKYSEQTVEKNGIDIEILFDVSYSMTATDLKPNRLEIAKQVFSEFIDGLASDRVGMIVFAGRPFTSFPLTFDYAFVKEFLKGMQPDTIDQSVYDLQWTAIWDAMILWEAWFQDDNSRERIMILLTDGEANRWMNPISAIKYLKNKNIKVYTIGVWWTEKTTVVANDTFWNAQKLEVWWVDEETLKKIASETDWKYYRATSSRTLKEIIQEIGGLHKSKIEEKKTVYEKPFIFPLLVILFFLLGLAVILRFRNIKI